MAAKKKQQTRAPPAAERKCTPFELKVHAACKAVPKGKVTTYGAIAKVLASAPRAVGQALRRNPYAPVVPCHRVVAGDLMLGGFKGNWGTDCEELRMKKKLLMDEGVNFQDTKVAAKCVVTCDELAEILTKTGAM